jgi:hypothetical protein
MVDEAAKVIDQADGKYVEIPPQWARARRAKFLVSAHLQQ